MNNDKMREEYEAWHCEQYKTKHTTGAPTRDMHNGVWDQDYCSKKSQALWEYWQKTGGDAAKVEALKEGIERIEEGKQPVAWFRSDALGCAVWNPFATQRLKDGSPLSTRPDSDDAIREMSDELADLRARLAERDALLRKVCRVGLIGYLKDEIEAALSASAEPSAPKQVVWIDMEELPEYEPGARYRMILDDVPQECTELEKEGSKRWFWGEDNGSFPIDEIQAWLPITDPNSKELSQ